MDLNSIMIRRFLFPAMEKFKGNNIQKNIAHLKHSQSLTKHELEILQKFKLKKLLLYCVDHVPAYSSYQSLKREIERDPLQALHRFPVLTKQAFRQRSSDYVSSLMDEASLIPNRTGGSTGEPVKFYIDRHTVEYYEAARYRGLSWWNIQIGERCAMIWGSPIELRENKKLSYKLKERFLKNRIVIPAYDLNPDSLHVYIDTLNQFRPSYLYGYASSLYLLAKLMLRKSIFLNFIPKAVLSTSETLYDFQREAIEEAFKCTTINEYGARDGGILAYQCPEKNMHLTQENAYIEIVDVHTKTPVEHGESGLVLVTDLNNFAMPRLRYELGDVAALSAKQCSCGIQLPLLEKIEGREDDIFVTPKGNYVHGHLFNHIARNLDGIQQFQAIQHSKTDITLKIVKNEQFTDKQIQHFRNEILKSIGDIHLQVEFVNEIPRTQSGKTRYTFREFPLNM